MNKVLQSCLLALAVTSLFSACQKDNEHLVDLTAVIVDQPVSNAKVYIDGNYGCWHQGDYVKIKSGSNGTADYALVVSGSEESATRATIPDVTEGAPYTAGYPAGNATVTGNGTLTLDIPEDQTYAEAAIYSGAETVKQRIVCPMAAYSPSGDGLKFYNVAAMLAITVTNSESSDLSLYAVEVESDRSPLAGTASVSVDANGASITGAASTSQSVTLTFGTTVTLAGSESRTVYIPVLPIGDSEGEKSTLTVHVKATKSDGTKKYTFHGVSANAISIEANQIGNVPVTLDVEDPETAVNDYFWGLGTEECPFLIENETDLLNLRNVTNNSVSGYYGINIFYKQTADIEIDDITNWGQSTNYAIGKYGKPFRSNYDGNGYSVKLGVTSSAENYPVGIFGVVSRCTIKNLTSKGSISMGSSKAMCGGIVGTIRGSATLYNCRNEATITSSCTNSYDTIAFAGIVGVIAGGPTINTSCSIDTVVSLLNCTNNGSITKDYGYGGGICGSIYKVTVNLIDCVNDNTVESTHTAGGGITGTDQGVTTYTRCHNLKAINSLTSSGSGLGGIIGSVRNIPVVTRITMTDCTNEGAVTQNGNGFAGGMIGKAEGSTAPALSFTRCTNTGDISVTKYSFSASSSNKWPYPNNTTTTTGTVDIAYVGGLIGVASRSGSTSVTMNITDCINEGKISGQGHCVGGLVGCAWQYNVNVSGNSITGTENRGIIVSNNKYLSGGIVGYVYNSSMQISGIITNKGYINCGTGCYIGGIVGGVYGAITVNSGSEVTNRRSVKGSKHVGGLFGCVYNTFTSTSSTLSNAVDTTSVSGSGEGVGGILGYAMNTVSISGTTSNSGTITNTNSSSGLGGIVGYVSNKNITISGTITNSGNVTNTSTGTCVGGIIGYGSGSGCTVTIYGTITNSGQIQGYMSVGGVVGYANKLSLNSSSGTAYNKGNIIGTGGNANSAGTGGIAGTVSADDANNCIKNCKNENTISTSGNAAGGIVGRTARITIDRCLNIGSVVTTGGGNYCGVGGIVGFANVASGTIDITNCGVECSNICTTAISTRGYRGGIVGYGRSNFNIENCYAIIENMYGSTYSSQSPYGSAAGIFGLLCTSNTVAMINTYASLSILSGNQTFPTIYKTSGTVTTTYTYINANYKASSPSSTIGSVGYPTAYFNASSGVAITGSFYTSSETPNTTLGAALQDYQTHNLSTYLPWNSGSVPTLNWTSVFPTSKR